MAVKRGAMGIGMLVVLIALLIVAAVAASLIISTTGTLKDQTHTTYQEAKGKINTHVIVQKIRGQNGRNGYLNELFVTAKMAPGSEALDFRKSVVVLNGRTRQAILRYREDAELELGNQGYNTWREQIMTNMQVWNESRNGTPADTSPEIDFTLDGDNRLYLDLDSDAQADYALTCGDVPGLTGNLCNQVCNSQIGEYVLFILSSAGNICVPVYEYNGGICDTTTRSDMEGVLEAVCVPNLSISDGNTVYGYFEVFVLIAPPQVIGGQGAQNPDGGFPVVNIYKRTDLNEDLDDDGFDDWMYINKTHVIFNLSDTGQLSLPLGAGVNLDNTGQNLDLNDNITINNITYGYVRLSGTNVNIHAINHENDTGTQFMITPERFGEGYYAVEYLVNSTQHLDKFFVLGDIIKFYLESPEDIEDFSSFLFTFIPNQGIETVLPVDVAHAFEEELEEIYP